tara:strand:+ start:89 stop:2092 length:2004 start_codon:yes stop_codon:yes gene_type:complete
MGVQSIGGSRVYVITGTKSNLTSGEAWANFVTQQKYRLWEESMKEAERQIGYDRLDQRDQLAIYNEQRKDLLRRAQEKERQAERLRTREINVKQGLSEDKVREENLRGRPKRMTSSSGRTASTNTGAQKASVEQSRELSRYKSLGTELYFAEQDRKPLANTGQDTTDIDEKIDDLKTAQEASWDNYESLAGISGVTNIADRDDTDSATSRKSKSYYTSGATIQEALTAPEFSERATQLSDEATAFRQQAAELERPTMERRSVLGEARNIYANEFAQPAPRRDGLGFARFIGRGAVEAAQARGEQITPEREQQIKREALLSVTAPPTAETEEVFVDDLLAGEEQDLFSGTPSPIAETDVRQDSATRMEEDRAFDAEMEVFGAQVDADAQAVGRTEAEAGRRAFPKLKELTAENEALRRRQITGGLPLPRDIGATGDFTFPEAAPATIAPLVQDTTRDMELRMLGMEPQVQQPPQPPPTAPRDMMPTAAPAPLPELADVLVETDTFMFVEPSADTFMGLTAAGAEQELNKQMAAVDRRFTTGTEEHQEQVNKLMDAYAKATKPYRSSVIEGAQEYDSKKLDRTTKGPDIPKWAQLVSSLFDPNNPDVRRDKKTYLQNAYEQITVAFNKEPKTMQKAHELLIALDTITEQSKDAEAVSLGDNTNGEITNQ